MYARENAENVEPPIIAVVEQPRSICNGWFIYDKTFPKEIVLSVILCSNAFLGNDFYILFIFFIIFYFLTAP